MILNAEQLRQKAHELALIHDPYLSSWPSKGLWRDFHQDVKSLRLFLQMLQDSSVSCSQPAEEWLLDNADFIEEQVLVVKQQLNRSLVKNLPRLRKTGDMRIFNICSEYLQHVDGNLDEDSLTAFINSYQQVSVLKIAEVWAIPLIIRIALIRHLARVAQEVKTRRQVCTFAEELLARIGASDLNPDILAAALEEAGQEMPLSGSMIVHLIRHLRERADDSHMVQEWLMCNLEDGPASLDQVVSYEYQLQARHQVTTGNIVASLRNISRWNWQDRFEQLCMVEHILGEEASGVYPRLDFSSRDVLRQRVEKLARRLRVPETLVAREAVQLAAREYEEFIKKQPPCEQEVESHENCKPLTRPTFAAYYLLEPSGIKKLRQALKICGKPRYMPELHVLSHPTAAYFLTLGIFMLLALFGFTAWIAAGRTVTSLDWIIVLLAVLLPASEWAVTFTHWFIEFVKRPQPLLKYDFSRGIPFEAATLVVIPVIWSTVKEVQSMVSRLELHYLANRDANLHLGLLVDLTDAKEEVSARDSELNEAARTGIESLNRTYSTPGGSTFNLFQRHRTWNESEGVWMGWERKRGALVELVELIKGKTDTTCRLVVGDPGILAHIRYIITLDADTQLPLESARRMIGAMHLPYNRPVLNEAKTCVIEGYGVLQPCISISHRSALRSRFASLYSADPGIDPYTFAVSDPYQDGLGQGIFTGKGIFDVDTFAQILCERIPENRVLSHDLLEGGFLRTGLLSDVELIDEYPSTFSSYQKRLHRWVRGDWQLIPWLFRHVHDRRGQLLPVDLPLLVRWQMFDNLRHSLLLPVQLAVLLLGLTVLPGSPGGWAALVLATLSLPLIRQLGAIRRVLLRPRNLVALTGQVLVAIITWPFQSVLLLDAIIRTLYRLFVSRRNLLEWVSAAEVERRNRSGRYPLLLYMYGGYVLIILSALIISAYAAPAVKPIGLGLCFLWSVAPFVVRWLNQPVESAEDRLAPREEEELKKLAHRIWQFFEAYVTEEDNWLPPDNVQIEPPVGTAHRTSPTNIGLYLACVLAARDFGFIDTPGMIERVERTVSTVESLAKWKGHLYNWYDTVTLEPLSMPYVSTVDSGNFLGCLIAVREGIAEWLRTDAESRKIPGFGNHMAGGEAFNFALAGEALAGANTYPEPGHGEKSYPRQYEYTNGDWQSRGQKLLEHLDALIDGTEFTPLYNRKTKLFHLGYRVSLRETDQVLYDLLASEARLASFIAIALGQVPVAHWHALGRTMARVGRRVALLSWSGSMFEYLMPWLFMRTYQDTVWDKTYRAVVKRQVEYAHQRGVPFGISESGYYAFDYRMNYQYRAFGVPGLGFKRGLEQDLVVAPYATILGLPFAKKQGINDLHKMIELGALGRFGFYEALDFTPERLPENQASAIVKSYMSHHQGMSMLALANTLLPQKIYERFHRDKRVQAAELLLQERMPARPKIIKHPTMAYTRKTDIKEPEFGVLREFPGADTAVPEVCLLSNGTFTTMVTNSGSGFMRYGGLAVSRWREDPVLDNWGNYIYIRDVTRDMVWSPSFQPCRVPADEQRVQFSPDRATFMRRDGDIQTSLEICVSPEWNADVRRLTITNTGNEARIIEVTTFSELVLASPMADEAHPAFNKLFIKTEYEPRNQCLLAWRRPRHENERPLWAAHALEVTGPGLGPIEYETDRASFIGRGRPISRPQGIRTHLRGAVGSVSDPAFIMRRRLSIEPGEQVQLYAITAVADSREDVLDIVGRFSGSLVVERTFQLAWNRSQIEMRHFHLTAHEVRNFQTLAGRILFYPPLRKRHRQVIINNSKGQSGLWAYGISGDLPIILMQIENRANLQFVVRLVTGHEYLRRMGCSFDLVILNESPGGYQEELRESLRRAVEHGLEKHGGGPGNIFIVSADKIPEEDKTLLMCTARMILRAHGPSLRAQTKPAIKNQDLPGMLAPGKPPNRFPASPDLPRSELVFFNGWGGFSPDGSEYEIILKDNDHLPAPWINVTANPQFGCLISELGTGYTWWKNSREFKLTPWSNDPVLDYPGEMCYLRDEESGDLWSPTPFRARHQQYKVNHGRGYTRFSHSRHGISSEMTVFVPTEDPVKVIKLRLHNRTGEERHLSITYYAEWVLGVRRQENAPFIITDWDETAQVLLAYNNYQEIFRSAVAFLGVFPHPDNDAETPSGNASGNCSWTGDRSEFLGRNGTWESPAAMSRESLSGRTGTFHEPCGAVQVRLVLKPDSERTVYILMGCGESQEAATQMAQKYSSSQVCDRAFEDVGELWRDILDQITVNTPSPEMNFLLNTWLLYQTIACRMWARSGFYQAGGAYGFRDQLQDSLAVLHSRPDLTRAQILFHARHQYEEGDVQHWWHEETHRGIRTHFSDDYLWLPYTVARYIKHTGDTGILDEVVPYLSSEPLQEDEYERYESTCLSERSGTVLEHCLRAIDRSLNRFGEHGLPLIGVGDWNDALSRVGSQGRGESVWLGWFLCEVLRLFAELFEKLGDMERAEKFTDIRAKLAVAINEHAWDGQWYRRAFTDAGQWLGSIYNEECRIDALAQSWSVISGAAPPERAQKAMQSFDRELVDRELSVVRLLTPPFEHTEPNPGYIQGYPPGIRENGGQYTHGAIWGIVAWCRLGNGNKAFELFNMLNPVNHTLTATEVRQYTGEPYAMAADVYTAKPHEGTAGWTWYTGAAGWMYQAGIEWILGLRRSAQRLYICPCIPSQWVQFSVSYRYGRTRYLITVKNPSRKCSGVTGLQIDGQVISPGEEKEGSYVELHDDGQLHHVVVTL
ncbi:MAG: GH36-type glycosyl hydrolase domain-containing protein [Syntrophomonadales bacterium]